MNNDSQRGASSAAPSWARLACRGATTMAVLLFSHVREHTRRSPLSQRVLVKQMGLPTSNCIALPMLDLSLWAAVGQAFFLSGLLQGRPSHLRSLLRFPCRPQQHVGKLYFDLDLFVICFTLRW